MTQGLVSICVGGQVVMKFVTGCDGYNSKKLADRIKEVGVPSSLEEAYHLAKEVGFGVEDSLVVLNKEASFFKGEEELSYLYRETFNDPEFNPRWSRGTCEYLCVVDIDK